MVIFEVNKNYKRSRENGKRILLSMHVIMYASHPRDVTS